MSNTKRIIATVLMTFCMALAISGFFALTKTGFAPGWHIAWLKGFASAWPLAFILSLMIAKPVNLIAEKISDRVAG